MGTDNLYSHYCDINFEKISEDQKKEIINLAEKIGLKIDVWDSENEGVLEYEYEGKDRNRAVVQF